MINELFYQIDAPPDYLQVIDDCFEQLETISNGSHVEWDTMGNEIEWNTK